MFASHRPRETEDVAISRDQRARLVFYGDVPGSNPFFDKWLARLGKTHQIRPPCDYLVVDGKPGELWLRDRYIVLDLVPRGMAGERVTRAANRVPVVH